MDRIKEGEEKNKEIMICCLCLEDADMRKAGMRVFFIRPYQET